LNTDSLLQQFYNVVVCGNDGIVNYIFAFFLGAAATSNPAEDFEFIDINADEGSGEGDVSDVS